MAPSIPDRWIPYKACGEIIEGTRIICFKVPLKTTVQQANSEIKEIWDIQALLKKIPKLGSVIDLTNTSRYYEPRLLQAAGITHEKILMPGRIIPPENKVAEFMDTIDELLAKNSDLLVGVHCTHGLNRTGYMVCRYMRDRLGMPAKDAIKKFEKARGYQIERENYIADLLGKAPPSPDLGKETMVKPKRNFHNRFDMTYKSPLNDYEDDSTDNNRNRYKRNYDERRTSWRSEGRSRSTKIKPSVSHSYDYKYDY